MQEHFYFSDVNLGVRKECIVLLCLPCATHRVDTYFFKMKMKLCLQPDPIQEVHPYFFLTSYLNYISVKKLMLYGLKLRANDTLALS